MRRKGNGMIWREYSEKLIEVLNLKGNPIAVMYSMTPADGTKEGKHCGSAGRCRMQGMGPLST